MTHEVRTPPLQPASGAAGTVATQRGAMDYVDAGLEWLWHTLTSMRVAMVLMIILAALCVAGSLIIQMTADQAADPASHAEFLDMVRPRFGGWATVMDAVGLFNIFNSLVFRVLVAALTISLVACSVHRVPGAWRTATKPRVDVGPSFFEHAPQRETIVVHATSTEALDTVKGVLRKRHYRTATAIVSWPSLRSPATCPSCSSLRARSWVRRSASRTRPSSSPRAQPQRRRPSPA